MDRFAIALWDRYFKEPVDSIPKQGDVLYVYMKKYLQTCKWFAVYDLLEFTVQNYPFSQPIDEYFVTELNEILKQEASGYRLIEGTVTAFDKLYGYTSDADGIRHALLEEVTLDFDDAKFMLVACSAFVNYIRAKVPGAGGLTSETDSSES